MIFDLEFTESKGIQFVVRYYRDYLSDAKLWLPNIHKPIKYWKKKHSFRVFKTKDAPLLNKHTSFEETDQASSTFLCCIPMHHRISTVAVRKRFCIAVVCYMHVSVYIRANGSILHVSSVCANSVTYCAYILKKMLKVGKNYE